MTRGVAWYLVGSAILVALAGCSRSWMWEQRAAWRHEAEAECMQSGAVKEGVARVRIQPIDGPGMCGADFPLKVSALGESSVVGYADELRPPASIPNASPVMQPRWPINDPPYATPTPRPSSPGARYTPPGPVGAPMPINPPGVPTTDTAPYDPAYRGAPAQYPPAPRYDPYGAPSGDTSRAPITSAPLPPPQGQYGIESAPYPSEPYATRRGAYPQNGPSYERPAPSLPPQSRPAEPPRLGPARGPQVTSAIGPAAVTPAATLACPLVSALDQWMTSAVQPAAMRWFGQPVAEIKQISAYSCRGMNGQPGAQISEHAFGNALDIAAFTLANGRRITVKDGWRGPPEEQGFLRDIQSAACQQFTTVLAPGSNSFHYNHIHVDLMRRGSGHVICQPGAVPGDLVAARARQRGGTAQRGEPAFTGSIASRSATTGKKTVRDDDDDWIEDEPNLPW